MATDSTATSKRTNVNADTRKLGLVHKGDINIVIDKTSDLNTIDEKFAK